MKCSDHPDFFFNYEPVISSGFNKYNYSCSHADDIFCQRCPQGFFHTLFANHTDGSDCTEHHTLAVFHKKGYHCHFDDVVVTAPFLLERNDVPVPASFYLSSKEIQFTRVFSNPFHQIKRTGVLRRI